MADKLREHLAATSTAKTGEATVNMLNWCGRATLDIIGSVGFGHDFECGESPEAKAINGSWSQIVRLGMTFEGGFVAPVLLRLFPFMANLPIKAVEVQGQVRAIVRDLALKIVQAREAAGEKPGKDLLSVLLQMKDKELELNALLDHVSVRLASAPQPHSNHAFHRPPHSCWLGMRRRGEVLSTVLIVLLNCLSISATHSHSHALN